RSDERRSGEGRSDDRSRRANTQPWGGGSADRFSPQRSGGRRTGDRDDRGPAGGSRAFDEADAQRAAADTWTTYTSSGGGPREVTPDNGFAAAGLSDRLVERLARDGLVEPFPRQAATIPDALAGRDVLGRGRTGSGTTLAFGLPTLTRLAGRGRPEPRRPRALVLVPTRELAMQVSDALQPFVHVLGLHHRLVAGGLSYQPQISALRRGVDLLVATPGRLTDLMERGAVELDGIEVAVLDEADHMADMGFLPEVTTILDALPAGGQRLLFSATLDRGVDDLVERYLVDPVTHSTDEAQAAVTTMSHHLWLVAPHDKKAVTAELAGRPGRVVVFARTQLGSDRIARELRERGVFAAALHGGLSQGVRNRVLGAFRDGRMPVLVATDVAARGIHVDDIGLVVQVDPPKDHKDYLHRAGRTARAGERGAVVMLALPHQRRMVAALVEAAGADADSATVVPGDATVRAVGGVPPSGTPVPDDVWRPVLEGGRRTVGPRGGRRPGRPGRPAVARSGDGRGRRTRDVGERRGRMGE
ncbi:MAG: DEAD/DEAH box helicase, partial [Phycicoccus sp.]